jgi:hypothetical protein
MERNVVAGVANVAIEAVVVDVNDRRVKPGPRPT